jgi:integrase
LVKRPKGQRRDYRTLTIEEARVLLDGLTGRRLDALITVALALGLRLGETLGLQWADVDFQTGRLSVRRSLQVIGKRRELAELKSCESRRVLALPPIVVRRLHQHKAAQAERRLAAGADWQRSDFVFTTRVGRPLDGTLVNRDLKRLLARTWMGGTKPDCKHLRVHDRVCQDCQATHLPILSFHGLRHSCASLLLAAAVPMRDVSELLGHSDVRLTLASYAHVLHENKAKVAGVMDQMLDPNRDSQTDSHTAGRG